MRSAAPRARYAAATGELEVSGSRAGLLALAGVLRSGGDLALAPAADPAPYDRALTRLRVRIREAGKVRVSVDGGVLLAEGGAESIAVLAENVEGFAAEADDPCHHLHIEHFPGFAGLHVHARTVASEHAGEVQRDGCSVAQEASDTAGALLELVVLRNPVQPARVAGRGAGGPPAPAGAGRERGNRRRDGIVGARMSPHDARAPGPEQPLVRAGHQDIAAQVRRTPETAIEVRKVESGKGL
jgi:hypothetical protein